jgi:3-hydroxyisobutyrate dehydrogenase
LQSSKKVSYALAVRDSIIIDCSTISPFSAIELNERASKHQIHYVDCPVSGGVGGAAAGTLSFMVGTNSNGTCSSSHLELYARCEAILSKMGKNLFKCEKPGGGQSAKICNNLALAIEMLGVSEALSLGVRLNLDP